MNNEELVNFCGQKEAENLKKIDFSNLANSELKKQEIHIKVFGKSMEVIRHHPIQDELRVNTFIHSISIAPINFESLNFEAIINFDDDVPDFDESAPRICFSKRKEHANILIPDPHIFRMCQTVLNNKSIDIDFDKKLPLAIFAGSDTGVHKHADKNQRFQFCYQNRNSELGKFKITNFVEIDKESLNRYADWELISSQFISIKEQLKYKYIININGNTTAWDRLLWAMASNSICFFIRPQEEQVSWYYPALEKENAIYYIDDTPESLKSAIDFFNNNPEEALKLKERQKDSSRCLVELPSHILYLKYIIEQYNKAYNNLS